MRLQTSPNLWSCLPTAFAMAIGCPVEHLIESIGHDGSEITWPNLDEPMCRRGFHIQEIIAVLTGLAVTPIERSPRIAPNLTATPVTIDNEYLFQSVAHMTRGVLTGRTPKCGHAVAYDHGAVCDPRGIINPHDFTPNCAWIIRNCK